MSVWIEGTTKNCTMTAEQYTRFTPYTHLTTFTVKGVVPCSLKGKTETIYVRFNNRELIKDAGGNALSTQVLHAYALRYVYVSDAEKAALDGAGSAFTSSSLVSFGLVIGLCLLQSVAVGSFWIFVNMLQVLSYVPAISCEFPNNLEVFLTEYLTVGKVSIPFDILPSWIPNPLSYLSGFITTPFNERFELCGYQTFSFIYNFADQLITWLLVLLFYILLRILTYMIPESK